MCALDKAIASGRGKRKPYRGAKAISLHCRNSSGLCSWCVSGRQWFDKKRRTIADEKIKEWKEKGWQD